MDVSGIFLKPWVVKSLLFSVRVLTCIMEFNIACHDKSIHIFLTCSVCLLMMQSQCVWTLGEGSNFQLVRGPQKLSFRIFPSRRSSLTQMFVGSCVDFEVAHYSILMVRRLPYGRFLP